MQKPVRIGVTGATGQVGSYLLRHLRSAGFEVVAAVRNPLGAALCDAVSPDVDIRVGSLVPDTGQRHLLDDCDAIVNCAIESAGGIPRQAYTRNRALIDGLLHARSLKWLLHFSTVAVYGELITKSANDRTGGQPRPGSEYGRSKLYVERYAARQARGRGVHYTAIRLGHIFGAGIARSRQIVELAGTRRFELPFGGRLPSNAIHADDVGAAIVRLLHEGSRCEVYGLSGVSSTWRDVFDWHTACLGLPPVPDMSDVESTGRRDAVLRQSLSREAVSWLRHLPVKSFLRSPATFDLALRVLVKTPTSITQVVSGVNRRTGARGHIVRAEAAATADVERLYLSDGMPGPFLEVPETPSEGLGSAHERARELTAWCELWRRPRMRAAAAGSAIDPDRAPAEAATWK